MTEHSSHMPRRVLEVQRCCFEYLGAECLPEFSSRNSCCYPQDIFEINNQPLTTAKQLFWSFLFVWIYMRWQVYNSTTILHRGNSTSKVKQQFPGPTGPSLIMFRKSWQSHQTPSLSQQLDTQKLPKNDFIPRNYQWEISLFSPTC